MESLKLSARVGSDGLLQIIMPPHFQNTEVEVTIVIQPPKPKNADLPAEKSPKPKIKQISEEFRQLRQSISPDTLSIRDMIEEGRRF